MKKRKTIPLVVYTAGLVGDSFVSNRRFFDLHALYARVEKPCGYQ